AAQQPQGAHHPIGQAREPTDSQVPAPGRHEEPRDSNPDIHQAVGHEVTANRIGKYPIAPQEVHIPTLCSFSLRCSAVVVFSPHTPSALTPTHFCSSLTVWEPRLFGPVYSQALFRSTTPLPRA